MSVYVVCEDKIDDLVLNALVIQPRNLAVQVVHARGAKGLGAIRSFLEARGTGDVAVTVRDRDYDSTQAEANAKWTQQKGREFLWRRHEIENFFLEPVAVLTLFNEWRGNGIAWAQALPASQTELSALLHSLATPLVPQHVAGLMRAEITQATNTLGSLNFTQPSATGGAAEWRAAVVTEAERLRAAGTQLAALPVLDSATIGARYDALLASCAGQFFLSGEYLREMGGKELLKALKQHLIGLGAPGKLLKTLDEQLLAALQRVYQPSVTFAPNDDFAELGTILASL